MTAKLISIITALLLIFFIGKQIDKYIQRITLLRKKDDDDNELLDKMNAVLFIPPSERDPNRYLGLGERILFFIAFYSNQPLIAASWLAFKLASKWQTWNSVIKMPEKLEFADAYKEFEIRNRYGTNLLQRWLIGTLANLLLGFASYIMADIMKNLFTT